MGSNPEISIRFYNANSNVYKSLTAFRDFDFSQGLESQSSNGTITVYNFANEFYDEQGNFEVRRGDYVLIFIRPTPTGERFLNASPDLAYIGRVKNVDDQLSGGAIVRINFADLTYDILSNSFSFAGESDSITLIEEILEKYGKNADGTSIVEPHPVNWPSLRPDGSAFPTIKYAGTKKVSELITELLTPSATNTSAELAVGDAPAGKPYYYYITSEFDTNKANKVQYYLNIRYPTDTVDYTIDLRSDDYVSYSVKEDNTESISSVIWTAGKDLEADTISGLYFDRADLTEGRQIFKPFTEISEKRFQDEVDAGNLTKDNVSGTIRRNDAKYAPDAYPLTTSWGVSVANLSEYNDSFRSKCEEDAKKIAQRFVSSKNDLTLSLTLKGTLGYVVGNYITIINPAGRRLSQRVVGVKHDVNGDSGWITTLSLAEDKNPVGII